MPKKKRKEREFTQLGLYGPLPEEPGRPREGEIIPLDFETHAIRMIMIRGQPWWVLADIARVLGYRDAEQAGRLLRDKHRGTTLNGTPGLQPGMLLTNEPGLYRLMMRSDRPEAERFQDWVTEDVLPTIRRTGSYTMHQGRIGEVARKLKCDEATAKARCDQYATNKASHYRLVDEGACPNDFKNWHDAGYIGTFNKRARELREALGIPAHDTPLNHMDWVPLSINQHAKAIAERIIRDAERVGRPIPLEDQPRILEQIAREMTAADLNRFGPHSHFEVRHAGRRGLIVDVARPSLN